MEIREPNFTQDFFVGVIYGERVESYKKLYKDMEFAYKEIDENLDKETEMYELYYFNAGEENTLLWGLTVLHPVKVKGECNLTRGHYHKDRSEPEIYFCLGGEGLLLYMGEDGEVFSEKVFKGSIHYIYGNYAHRLINTGEVDLKVGACWRELAGHDYESIEKKTFPIRIYKDGKNIIFK